MLHRVSFHNHSLAVHGLDWFDTKTVTQVIYSDDSKLECYVAVFLLVVEEIMNVVIAL